jgi:hypothetical protein
MTMTSTKVRSLIESDEQPTTPGGDATDPKGAAILRDIDAGTINFDALNGYVDAVHAAEANYLKMIKAMHKMITALRGQHALKKAGLTSKDVVEFVRAGQYDTGSFGKVRYKDWDVEASDIIGVKVKDPAGGTKFIEFDTPVRSAGPDVPEPPKFTGFAPKRKPKPLPRRDSYD